MSDHELPQGPGRVCWERGSFRVGGCPKEEGVWADMVSEETGLWIPPATWRTGRILTTPPSTRLTAWVCLLQPWSPRGTYPPRQSVPVHKQVCLRTSPTLQKPREGDRGQLQKSFPLACLPLTLSCRWVCRPWACTADTRPESEAAVSSNYLGAILFSLIPSGVFLPSPKCQAAP